MNAVIEKPHPLPHRKNRRSGSAAPPARDPNPAGSQFFRAVALTRRCLRHFVEDRCLVAASALSYATIVSLLPLTAIVLAIFSGLPFFEGARHRFMAVLLDNFAPDVGDQAAWWFQYSAAGAAQTTVVGAIVLIVTGILLLATIENHLQIIWRVRQVRAWYRRVVAYWIVLTLGPVLLGVGFSLPGYLDWFAPDRIDLLAYTTANWLSSLVRVVSFALECAAFTLLYCLIPNCPVRWRDAIAGAAVAAVAIQALKIAFVFFISRFSSYGTVYGAMAGVPIFLLWMYIFWAVVLFGAELAAAFGHRQVEDYSSGT